MVGTGTWACLWIIDPSEMIPYDVVLAQPTGFSCMSKNVCKHYITLQWSKLALPFEPSCQDQWSIADFGMYNLFVGNTRPSRSYYTWTLCKRDRTSRSHMMDVKETKRDLVSTRISYVLCTSISFQICCTFATRNGFFLYGMWWRNVQTIARSHSVEDYQ